jgi:adenine nucleotide transporter 17
MVTLLLRIYKKEGILGWYQGFAATMINTFSMRKFWFQYLNPLTIHTPEYAYFFFYSLVRSSYIKRVSRRLPAGSKPPTLSTLAELVLGAVAGALAQVFTIPVSVIATRQQLGQAEELGDSDNSFMSVAREIIEEDGVTGLWLGLNPGLVLTVNPAITYGLFERIKSMVLQTKGMTSTKMGPWLSFVVGALSKTLATVVSEILLSPISLH